MSIEPSSPPYSCSNCSFLTYKKTDWIRHLSTSKHVKMSSTNENKNNYVCEKCAKIYISKSSFYYHKKKCSINNKNNLITISEINNENIHSSKLFIMKLIENNNKLIENNKTYYEENMSIYLSNQKLLINMLKNL